MCGYFCIGFIDFMFAAKALTDYTTLFSPHDFQKKDIISWIILGINECNPIEGTNTYSSPSIETKFWLNEINEIKYYFSSEIQEKKNDEQKSE